MRKLLEVVRVANEGRNLLYNFVPRRGARFQENLKWVKPEKKPVYHPSRTGDLAPFPEPELDSIYFEFKESKELQNADEIVKKIFSLGYQMPRKRLDMYQQELIDKVKCHAYDETSDEVQKSGIKKQVPTKISCMVDLTTDLMVARLTAKIRYYQHLMGAKVKTTSYLKETVKEQIDRRKKKLKLLRLKDYKRFEWVLEKLDLEYRPPIAVGEGKVKRRPSLMRLAQLRVLQAKEEKLAAYRQALDKQKVPFLEKKILKLKEIKEKEEKYNLPATVKEEDIQECIEKLEKVKIEIVEKLEKGYARKIHPYFLEPYDEDLLWEKEKAAELIREKQDLENQKKTGETSVS